MVTRTKTKSREKLYNLIEGAKEVVGAAGRSAVGSIQFANLPTAGETVTIGGFVFSFVLDGGEDAPGASAGTVADPHLVSNGATPLLAEAGANLAAAVLAETLTTGAAGYLHPVDATGVDFTTDTLTLTFYPGTAGNAITLAGSAGDETIVQPVTASLGRLAPTFDLGKKTLVIDTTGSTQDEEYYILPDGDHVGQEVTIIVETLAASDTPTVFGTLFDTAAKVQVQFNTANEFVKLIWTGANWKPVELAGGTVYSAA